MPRYYVTSHPSKVSKLMPKAAGEKLAAKLAASTGKRATLWYTDYDEPKRGAVVAEFDPPSAPKARSKTKAKTKRDARVAYFVQRYADRKTIDAAKEFSTVDDAMVDVAKKEAKGFRLVVIAWDPNVDKGTVIYTTRK